MVTRLCFAVTAGALAGAVPLANQKVFGHSIKNGALPARTEVTTFEHTCSTPPCVVTQVHVPSIYPRAGDAWSWTRGVVSFYVDGETQPSISLTLLELGGEAHFNQPGNNAQSGASMPDGSPWGIALMGRTAKSGAVYSTVRIPFGDSLRVTIRACETAQHQSTFWFILRGLEAHAVVLGDLELPATARLVVRRLPPTPVKQLQLVTLAQSPPGTAGALLRVQFDARGPSFGYLEACMRFYSDGATEKTPGAPLFLSSGAEDYFLSASYFDEGLFKTPNAGLTYFNRSISAVGAYKTHDRDPVLWRSGMKLVFRVCESIAGCGDADHCPNQFCNATQRAQGIAARTNEATTASTPVYSEYFLGMQGASCDAACTAQGLVCNDSMDLGDADHGATMMAHLNISGCLKYSMDGWRVKPLTWWAPDQPGYISGEFNHCTGFIGYPRTYSCSASFPTTSRVCHCTETAPGLSAGVEYGTLVLSYEWPTPKTTGPSTDPSSHEAEADTAAPLRLVQRLAQRGALSQQEQDDATDLLMQGDALAVRLLGAFVTADKDGLDDAVALYVARHLRRYLAKRDTAATVFA